MAPSGKTSRPTPPTTGSSVELVVDAASQTYTLKVDGIAALTNAAFLESSGSVERIVFRTGEFRLRDFTRRPQVDGTWLTNRIPNADVVQPNTRYDLDNVTLVTGMGVTHQP